MTDRTDHPRQSDHPAPPAGVAVDSPPTADLAEIIGAYNQVTDRLQRSHEMLTEEVRRLSAELASANTALQRSRRLAALGEMAAGIAHEIRNPLAAIQLYAELLESDLGHMPEQYDVLQRIVSAVRGLNAIVTDVLHFSRDMPVRPVAAPASELFQRAVESMAPVIAAAHINVHDDVSPHTPPVYHDPDLLHRALVNLIRNATEAMPEGGTLTLAADADTDSDAARLTVRDTGPGINPDAIDRIFNPFFTTRAAGTGLGLAIVHRVIDAHGGAIAVHNDRGAVFTLTLPGAPKSEHHPDPGATPDPAGADNTAATVQPEPALVVPAGLTADQVHHGG